MPAHATDSVSAKEVCVVFKCPLKFGAQLVEVKREVKLCGLGLVLERCHHETWKLHLMLGRVLQHEHYLHERAMTQIPIGLQLLDEIFKWQVLMRVCAEGRFADQLQ